MTIENQIKVVAALEAGKAKIVDPKNWTTELFARDSEGRDADVMSDKAVCFCSDGALMAAVGLDWSCYNSPYGVAYRALCDETDGSGIINYNDSHTHAEVMEVWDKAIQQAKDKLVVLNLERLIAAVEQHPEVEFNLDYFKVDTMDCNGNVCGTLFCTAGLATTLPEFKAAGFELVARPNHHYPSYSVQVNGDHIVASEDTDKTFGASAFRNLFAGRNDGDFDKDHGGAVSVASDDIFANNWKIGEHVTDKELALWRLNKQLAIYKEKVQ